MLRELYINFLSHLKKKKGNLHFRMTFTGKPVERWFESETTGNQAEPAHRMGSGRTGVRGRRGQMSCSL